MKACLERVSRLLVFGREMLSSSCPPVLVVFNWVCVKSTKNLSTGVATLRDIFHWKMGVSVHYWLCTFILLHHGCLVLAVVSRRAYGQ